MAQRVRRAQAARAPHPADHESASAAMGAAELDDELRARLANLFAVRMTDAFRGSYPNADFAAITTAYERAYLAYMESRGRDEMRGKGSDA